MANFGSNIHKKKLSEGCLWHGIVYFRSRVFQKSWAVEVLAPSEESAIELASNKLAIENGIEHKSLRVYVVRVYLEELAIKGNWKFLYEYAYRLYRCTVRPFVAIGPLDTRAIEHLEKSKVLELSIDKALLLYPCLAAKVSLINRQLAEKESAE